jgi:glycosyltransferase involved in cell wall biosynthesis
MVAEDLEVVGGVPHSTLALGEDLSRRRHEVALLYGHDGPLTERWNSTACRMRSVGDVKLPRRHPITWVRRAWAGTSFARAFRPDVVYCHSMNQLPLAILMARASKAPVVMHLRSEAALCTRRNRRRLSQVAAFMSVSEATRREWASQFPGVVDGACTVPPSVSLDQLAAPTPAERRAARAHLSIGEGQYVLAFLGRLIPEKGVAELIQAHSFFADRATLLVAGSSRGHDPSFEAEARRLSSDSVRFLGEVSDSRDVYFAADAVIVPSHREPFGRVVIEALACEIPVYGSCVGGIPEILGSSLEDHLFEPQSVEQIRDVIERCLAGEITDDYARRAAAVARRFDIASVSELVETTLSSASRHQ